MSEMSDDDRALWSGRVDAGAALLDTLLPGWAHDIDLALLDMECSDHCVLGQLYGSFYCGRDTVGLDQHGTACHGFITMCPCDVCTADWRLCDQIIEYTQDRFTFHVELRLEAAPAL